MNEQMSLYEDNPEYEAFVEKFKPKKTTDDCYTPPEIYEVIRDWACSKFGIDPLKIVRPFYPGGDFQNYRYPDGDVVLDNPPFSILSKICEFYIDRRIPFFLFAPSMTCFSGAKTVMKMNHIVCDCDIEYENGAVVRTSFVTSFGEGIVAQTAPDLTKLVNEKGKELRKRKKKQIPKYEYPPYIVTAAMLQKYSKYGICLEIRKEDCKPIRQLDAQKESGKAIYGGGLILSERAAAERAAAERAAAERAAAERAAAERAAAHEWELSEREREEIRKLG